MAPPAVYRPNNNLPIFSRPDPQKFKSSIQRQTAAPKIPAARYSSLRSVVQPLIVVDDDLDPGRLMAAAQIYQKWNSKMRPERITTTRHMNLSGLKPGEKLYLVAHGSETHHGGRTYSELATLLDARKLPMGNVVKLISCNTGTGDATSFAARLGNQLGRTNRIVGIRGLESSEKGHTRATIPPPQSAMEEYFKLLGDDKNIQIANEIVQKLKVFLATCDEIDVQPAILEAAQQLTKLDEEMKNKELDEFFRLHGKTLNKEESEYIHKASRYAVPRDFDENSPEVQQLLDEIADM